MEIERKFLVDRIPGDISGREGVPIEQGYLAIDRQSEVRLRRAGTDLTLTVKQGRGEIRDETEVEVDQATFDDLWPESEGRRISKSRYRIGLEEGLVAELDVYSGDLDGVAVVEVEFPSASAAARFQPPGWFGRELTGDPAWANQSLAVAGRPAKTLEFRLRPDEEQAAGVCRVIAARTAQAAAAVRLAGEAEESAGHVHEARKSLKKARSGLRLLRGVIGDEERRNANQACREAAGRLAGARDAEVKLATLELVVGKGLTPAGSRDWRADLAAEAAGHRDDLTPAGLAEVAKLIEEVGRSFRGREPEAGTELVAANTVRGYRRGRRLMKRAGRDGSPEDFHDWRKRAKDLRYQLEILEPRLSGEFVETRKRAEELADQLGDLHDLDVLAEDLSNRDLGTEETRVLAALIEGARGRLVKRCLETGDGTYRVKPGRFRDRLVEELSRKSAPS